MPAKILDGKTLASNVRKELKHEIALIKEQGGSLPRMVNIMIGDDDGTCAYAKSQKKVATDIGIDYELKVLKEEITQKEFIQVLKELNADKSINGIMIHKPVPEQIDYVEAASYVDPLKDLEGINTVNIGKMILSETNIIPCTPASVMEHLKSTGESLRGKEVVVIGHSTIVGRPLSMLLLDQMATVTVCHLATSEAGKLTEHIARADILIVAVGKASLIKGEWIKPGAIVIDVGINLHEGKIVGDVEFDSAQERASYITPVPGGVGPVTVVMLMRNALEALKMQNRVNQKK